MIKVIAGIIEVNGEFLIAQRKDNDHLANKWEFPGGKLEKGETPEECIVRELYEELGINVSCGKLIAISKWEYPEISIELSAYQIRYLSGNIIANNHKEIRWIKLEDFGLFNFADADIPILDVIRDSFYS